MSLSVTDDGPARYLANMTGLRVDEEEPLVRRKAPSVPLVGNLACRRDRAGLAWSVGLV